MLPQRADYDFSGRVWLNGNRRFGHTRPCFNAEGTAMKNLLRQPTKKVIYGKEIYG